MPRIPSAADVSPIGAGASRLACVRAEAEDFGLALGRGLSHLGDGLAAARPLVEEVLRKEEQQQQAEQEVELAAHRAGLRDAGMWMADDWTHDGDSPREAARKSG